MYSTFHYSSALLNLRESYRTIYSLDGNLEFYRIPGVLQRFGVCYLFVAMMQLLLRPTNNEDRKVQVSMAFYNVYSLTSREEKKYVYRDYTVT